jgi:predicted nucleic acid-binding protein
VRLLIDNSVWARLADPAVSDALKRAFDSANPDDVMICPPIAAEIGFSARTAADHTRLIAQLAAFADCPAHPTSQEVLALQNALWSVGLLRAAGATDTVIAAYAIANEATLLHYDRDFEHIAAVAPRFSQQWIVPRGTQ